MARLLSIISLFALAACATLTAEGDQTIHVLSEPAGASCTLHNDDGTWHVEETPGYAEVERDFSPLKINCTKDALTGSGTLEAETRGRAYGNILLLGVPALVDAKTGNGYEYAPDSITIPLK